MSLQRYANYAQKKYPAVKRRANVYVPAVKQLASDVMYLKGIINSEPKNFYLTSQANFDWNGSVISLCDVAQGDSGNMRDGNRILPKYLSINCHINKDTAGNMHTTVRYIIFRWWGESANAPGVSPFPGDILMGSVIGTTYAPIGFLSNQITGQRGDRNRRIEVHRTGTITLDNVSKTCCDIKEVIKLNGKNQKVKEHIEYYDGGTAPPISGGFFMLFIQSTATGADVQYTLNSHFTYYDN